MTISFKNIKELPDLSTTPSPEWVKYHLSRFEKYPDSFRKDYEKLVKLLESLHAIEKTIRKDILHVDAESSDLREYGKEVSEKVISLLLTQLLRKI